jgi:hypothetical protein
MHIKKDASQFFFPSLMSAKVEVYGKRYPNLQARKFVPVDNRPWPFSAKQYTVSDVHGESRIGVSYNGDIPTSDGSVGTPQSVVIHNIDMAAVYSKDELEAGSALGVDLVSNKLQTCRDSNERALNKLLLFGNAATGATGLFNQTGINTYTGFGGAISAISTAAEMLKKLTEFRDAVNLASKDVHDIDTIIMPGSIYSLLATTPMSGSSTSVLMMFKEANPQISIERSGSLEATGPLSTTRMIGYQKDPSLLVGYVPTEFEADEPQRDGFVYNVPTRIRASGVVAFFPKSIVYASGV